MYKTIFQIEAYVLAIILAVFLVTCAATYLGYVYFGWVAVPVPSLLVALALWARVRYLR